MHCRSKTIRLSIPLFFCISFFSQVYASLPAPQLNVSVDPRIELYSVVLLLSGFNGPSPHAPMLNGMDMDYKRLIQERFGSMREHEAVKLYREMGPKGFWLGHPPTVMLHLSAPDSLVERYPQDTLQVQLAGGRDRLEAFLAALRDFSRRSRFMEFYASQDSNYAIMVDRFRGGLDPALVGELEAYFGGRQNSYSIILAPLFMFGGYGPRVRVSEGRYDTYYIYGPDSVEAGAPVFENVPWITQHEFSHSFVNYLTTEHLDSLLPCCDVLMAGQRKQAELEGELDWWPVIASDQVSENVVRAVTSRLIRSRESEEKGRAASQHETDKGYTWVNRIYERLAEYESHRDKYTTFKEFYPRIVEVFQQAAREKQSGK